MEALRTEIESAGVLFEVDSSLFTAEQIRAGKILAAKCRQWVDYANGIERTPLLIILGYADPTGSYERNVALSRQRAEHLAELLVAAGISPALLSVEDRGKSTERAANRSLERRAVIRLSLSDPAGSAR
jgi:outer membrane protein OmpA-like peptidoglycan-associated protein